MFRMPTGSAAQRRALGWLAAALALTLSTWARTPAVAATSVPVASIELWLQAQALDGLEPAAQQQVLADLNGDGQPETVLLWSLLGPTFSYTRLTVLRRAGTGWSPAGSIDVVGIADDLEVHEGRITVHTRVLAPHDPRCCPSVERSVHWRWDGQALLPDESGPP